MENENKRNLPQINLQQAQDFLLTWIRAGYRKPVILWGAPGLGKSAIINALPSKLDTESVKWGLIDLRLSQLDPVDLRGVPSVRNGITVWNTPSWLPTEKKDGEHGILFLDEIFLSAPSVQAAAYQLMWDRKLGDYTMPPNWIVLAASNRPEDKAGIGGSFNAALANRFAAHFDILCDVDAWSVWASENDVVPELIAFLKFKVDLLHEFASGGIPKGTVAYATPRSWEAASDILKLGLTPGMEQAALEGCVGKGPAAELVGFLQVCKNLPDIEDIFKNPKSVDIPDDPSTQYAISALIAHRVDQDTLKAGIKYLSRISPEFSVIMVRDAIVRDPDLKETKAFINFKIKYSDYFLTPNELLMKDSSEKAQAGQQVAQGQWSHECKTKNTTVVGPMGSACPDCGSVSSPGVEEEKKKLPEPGGALGGKIDLSNAHKLSASRLQDGFDQIVEGRGGHTKNKA